MNKNNVGLALFAAFLLFVFGGIAHAVTIIVPSLGGTGTSVTPSYGQVLVGTGNGVYTPTATSSLGIGASANAGGSPGQLQWNSAGIMAGVSTTSVSCGSGASCTSFTAIGSSPVTITATGGSGGTGVATTSLAATWPIAVTSNSAHVTYFWNGIATSTNLTAGHLIVASGAGTLTDIATSTLTPSSPLTGSFTQIGSGGSLGLDTTGTWTGNAGSATKLATARAINGVNFDGTAAITISAASSTALSDLNTWTGKQTFGNASTTVLSATTFCLIGDTCRTTWPTGGSGVWPFTTGLTNFGVPVQSTSTPEWFTAGLHASSTSQLVNANVWGTLGLKGVNSALLSTDASGNVVATTTLDATHLINTVTPAHGGLGKSSWLTGSIPYFNGTNFTEDNANFSYDGATFTFPSIAVQSGGINSFFEVPGTLQANNSLFGAGGVTLSASTSAGTVFALTPAQFCLLTTVLVPSSNTTTVSIVFPDSASVSAACGNLTVGEWGWEIFDNQSNYPLTLATTTGSNLTFRTSSGSAFSSKAYPVQLPPKSASVAVAEEMDATNAQFVFFPTTTYGNNLASTTMLTATTLCLTGDTCRTTWPTGGSSASSTLLSDNNTFSGNNTFSSLITGSISGNAGTATKLATTRAINGVNFDGSAAITITAASSTLLADLNNWTGRQTFTAASTTNLTATSYWMPGQSAGCAQFDANGKLTSIGANCGTSSGGITQINTTWPLLGGPITTTGTLTFDGIATSAAPVVGNLPYWTGAKTLGTVATSTLTAASPLTGSFVQLGSGGSLGIQAASASQNGYLAASDWSLLHTATTTFSSPLVYTLGTNAVTCPTCLTGNQTITLSGDVTGSGATSITTTLASTSIGANYITGTLGSINGTAFTRGSSITLTAASSTLLANNNTWTGLQSFGNASSTLFTATTVWLPSLGTPAGTILAVDPSGKIIATSTPTGGGGGGTPGGSSGQIQFNSSGSFAGTSGLWWDSTNSRLGIGTTTPPVGLTVASSTSILNYEGQTTYSTSMTVNFASSTNQLVNGIGTSATTITLAGGQPGSHLTLTTCNGASTANTLTFTNGHYSGGVQPGNSTTASVCDTWSWYVSAGTSTPIYILEGMTPAIL